MTGAKRHGTRKSNSGNGSSTSHTNVIAESREGKPNNGEALQGGKSGRQMSEGTTRPVRNRADDSWESDDDLETMQVLPVQGKRNRVREVIQQTCIRCDKVVESDGRGEFVHKNTGKYGCAKGGGMATVR